MSETTYIFSHIPKTAGTTIRKHFCLFLKEDLELIHFARTGNIIAKKKGISLYKDRTLKQREFAKIIIGHNVDFNTKYLLFNNKVQEVITFRNPLKWEVSRYNQYVNRLVSRGQEPISFDYWINQIPKLHSQFDWFLANYLCLSGRVNLLSNELKKHLLFSTLNNFTYVLTTNDVNNFISYLQIKMGFESSSNSIVSQKVVGINKVDYFIKNKKNNELLSKICKDDLITYNQIKKSFPSNFENI